MKRSIMPVLFAMVLSLLPFTREANADTWRCDYDADWNQYYCCDETTYSTGLRRSECYWEDGDIDCLEEVQDPDTGAILPVPCAT